MVCLNKILQDNPELKIARKGIKFEESFFYACHLCDGNNSYCSEYIKKDVLELAEIA
jgi:hypothetical protein